jgi:DNA-directed RNA polymerase specialized sigma24 family protein
VNNDNFNRPRNFFPETRHSALWLIKSTEKSERRRGIDTIARAYSKPVERYIQLKWESDRDSARDTAQSFFLAAIDKGYFAEFDPSKARFRTFLRLCVDRYVMKQLDAEKSIKRGGATETVRIDDLPYEGLQVRTDKHDLDQLFDQEWARSVLAIAVETLQTRCEQSGKQLEFQLFERYDIADHGQNKPTYGELAGDFGITPVTVTNHLAWARREFRTIVLAVIRDLTASDEEYREEVRSLLGVNLHD